MTTFKGEVIEGWRVGNYYHIDEVGNEYYDCIGCPVKVFLSSANVGGYVANPEVNLPGSTFTDMIKYTIIDLPSILGPNSEMVHVDTGENFVDAVAADKWTPYFKPYDEFWLNSTVDSTQCDDHPPTSNAAFKVKATGLAGDKQVDTLFPSIFGKAYNDMTGEFNFLLFDPMLQLKENTVENPITEGGCYVGAKKHDLDRDIITDYTFCSNAPRNFLNEHACKFVVA